MSLFGPISSIFDFMTFFVMIRVLHASHSEFRSGWFVESVATQTLVVFLIRTRRVPFFRSRPSRLMLVTPLACGVLGVLLPFTPIARFLGFSALPIRFFLILLAMTITYLALVEFAKDRFYAAVGHPERPRATRHERRRRHVARRVARYTRYTAPPTGLDDDQAAPTHRRASLSKGARPDGVADPGDDPTGRRRHPPTP